MTPAAVAIAVLSEIPALIKAGIDVLGLVESTNATITAAQAEKRKVTDAEWDALDAKILDLRGQLQG